MASTCAFSTLASIQNSPESDPTKPPGKLGWFKQTSNSTPNGNLNFKASVQPPIMTNNALIKARGLESPSPSGFNRFLDPMSSIFTEEVAKSKDWFSLEKFVENGLVFRQNFAIRSYEIGPDGKVSMEALMNHLQETGLNHMKLTGLLGDGLGSTPEMCSRKLIWVATKVELVVDRYPTWGDDVVIDNWIVASGKNTMRRDSVIRDSKTGESLIRASSNWVVMNKETRRLSRIPEEVRDEMSPYLKDASPIIEDESRKLPKLDDDTANYILPGLKPRWSDLDINQHVNNGKYIGWILESAPNEILENREISRVVMEYRRECHRDDELQSLTAICGGVVSDFADLGEMECHHMLRVEDGAEVMRARTEWRPKNICTIGNDN